MPLLANRRASIFNDIILCQSVLILQRSLYYPHVYQISSLHQNIYWDGHLQDWRHASISRISVMCVTSLHSKCGCIAITPASLSTSVAANGRGLVAHTGTPPPCLGEPTVMGTNQFFLSCLAAPEIYNRTPQLPIFNNKSGLSK